MLHSSISLLLHLNIAKSFSHNIHQPCDEMFPAAEVFCQRFFMKVWGHATAKPTIAVSNTPKIISLDHGPCKRKFLESDVKTTTRYESKDGRRRFTGNSQLKPTQFLIGSQWQCDSTARVGETSKSKFLSHLN